MSHFRSAEVLEVNELGFAREPGSPSQLVRAPAEVEILRVHEARLAQAAEALPRSPSTSMTAPVAASISRDRPWLQCVLRRGCQRSGTNRLRPLARTSAGSGVVNGTTLGCSVRSGFRSLGTTIPTSAAAQRRQQGRDGARPVHVRVVVDEQVGVHPGAPRSDVARAANPTLASTRTSTEPASAARDAATSCGSSDRSRRRRSDRPAPRPRRAPRHIAACGRAGSSRRRPRSAPRVMSYGQG